MPARLNIDTFTFVAEVTLKVTVKSFCTGNGETLTLPYSSTFLILVVVPSRRNVNITGFKALRSLAFKRLTLAYKVKLSDDFSKEIDNGIHLLKRVISTVQPCPFCTALFKNFFALE